MGFHFFGIAVYTNLTYVFFWCGLFNPCSEKGKSFVSWLWTLSTLLYFQSLSFQRMQYFLELVLLGLDLFISKDNSFIQCSD